MNEYEEQLKQQAEYNKQLEALETKAKTYMTKEAISRYGTVKTAHPELAMKTAALIVQAAQQTRFTDKITDEQLKDILRSIQQPRKNITIKKV